MIGPVRRNRAPFLTPRITILCGFVITTACLFALGNSLVIAADAFPRIKESVISPNRPWPKGKWRPVASNEYRALLKAARPLPAGPKQARIQQAEYLATFDPENGTLRGGSFRAIVKRSGLAADFLWLDPLNVAISQLRWSDRDAVWGTTRGGQIALLVDRESGELLGQWSLKGRGVLNNTEFDLQIAPSLVTQLRLRIPPDWLLKCSSGDVHQPVADADSGWVLWRVDLGSQTSCRVTIVQKTQQQVPARRLVLYEQSTSLTVRQEALEAMIDLNLEVLRKPLKRLSFWLPNTMRVYSITYGSDDFSLSWQQSDQDGRRRFDIDFPDPLIGRSRQIRVQGNSTGQVAGKLRLPQLTVDGAVFLSGQLDVEVAPPLLLQDVVADGFRQIEIRDGRGLTFQQQRADASVVVDVAIPKPVISARALTYVTANSDTWSLVAEILWQDRWNSTFATRCRLPEQWEVTDVRTKSNVTPTTLSTWNIDRSADGARILTIEFNESLSKDNQVPIQIFARRQPIPPNQPVRIPVVEPLDCHKLQLLLVTSLPPTMNPVLEAETNFERIQQDALPAVWKEPDPAEYLRKIDDSDSDTKHGIWYSDASDSTGRFLWRETRNAIGSVDDSAAKPSDPTDGRTEKSDVGDNAGNRMRPSDSRSESNEDAQNEASFATAKLKSLIQFQTDGFDYHWITYSLNKTKNPSDFRFTLPAPAQLADVEVNGHTVSPVINGETYTVPQLPEGTIRVITIHYSTPATNAYLRNALSIVVPKISPTVLTFGWEFAMPPDMQLAAVPNGLILGEPLFQTSWSKRLFGPLGRPFGTRLFNPFDDQSWRQLFGETMAADRAFDDATRSHIAPAGWTRIQATAARAPAKLDVDIWNGGHVRLLAQIGMLISLTVGFLLRIFRSSVRGNVGAYWLAGCVVAACLLPSACAEIAGGCLIGTVLGALFPRSLLRVHSTGDQPRAVVSLDTTKSFKQVPASSLILFSVLLGTNAIAQEFSIDKARTERSNANSADGARKQFEVFIPNPKLVDSATDESVVYVPIELLDQLHDLRRQRAKPKYLISTAEYRSDVSDQGALGVRAKFTVVVLDPEPTTRVYFPISDARLGGRNPCLVDGKPQSVLRAQNDAGFELDLTKVITAAASPDQTRTFHVEFVLHPTPTSVPGGSGFRIGIPPVLASSLTLNFTKQYATVEIANSLGETIADPNAVAFTAHVGKSTELRVLWSAQQVPVRAPASLEAAISRFVEVHPTQLKHRYRVSYHIMEGRTGFVSWRVPWDAVIRGVFVDGQEVEFQFLPRPGSDSRVLIEFAEPRSTDFIVEVAYTLPIRSPQKEIVLPKRTLFDNNDQPDSLRVMSDQVGVAATAGFQLQPLTELTDQLVELPADTFLDGWDGSDVVGKPVVAYGLEMPAKLTFELVPLKPERQVRLNQIGRISKNRLDWTFTAEIKTTNAAAFQHTLVLHQGLKIHSISVQEDEAERLAHWSQVGNQLVLFLKDRTLFLQDKSTGIQNLVLHGSVPISLSEPVRLPSIGFKNATLADAQLSKLRLYHGVDLAVHFVDPAALKPLQSPAEARSDDVNEFLLGQFEYPPPGPSPGIRVSRLNQKTTGRSATLLEQRKDGPWTLRQRMQFTSSGDRIGVVELRIPKQMSDTYQLNAGQTKRRTEKLADGTTRITLFQPRASVKQSFSVAVTSELTEPDDGEWIVPQVLAVDVEEVENLLILAPSDRFKPVDTAVSQLDQADLPASVRNELLSEIPSPNMVFRTDRTRQWVLIRRQQKHEINEPARISLVESQVWVQEHGLQIGRTVIFADTPADHRLLMHWPTDTVLDGVFVDGQHVVASNVRSTNLRVPTGTDAGDHTIAFFWSRQRKARLAQINRIVLDVPFPRGDYVDRSVLTFVPRQDTYVFAGDEFERRFKSLEASMADTPETLPNSEQAGNFPQNLIVHTHAGTPGLLTDDLSTDEPKTHNVWTLQRRPITVLLAVIGFVIGILVSRRLLKLEFSEWLYQHQPISWALLGCIWWLCLRPSVIGIALIVVATILAIRQRMHPQASSDGIILDISHAG